MKNLFLNFAIIALIVSTSLAQGEVRFGIKGGLNLASLGGDAYVTGTSGFDSRTSFHIGGLVEIPISDKISVQPEVLYSAQGSKFNFGFITGTSDIKLDYLNIPIMGKYHIIAGLSGELGPVIGILVKANGASGDVKDMFKKTDIGVGIGATYRLPLGVFGSLRYNKGITDINDDPTVSTKNQNNVFQVSVGYSF